MLVLSVDLGLGATGYVVCQVSGSHIELIEQGQIVTHSKSPLPQRLAYIYHKLKEIIKLHNPQGLILERLYSHYKHPATLGVLAQLRGVVVLLGEHHNLEFCEFSPTKARKAIIGRGSANSSQVKKMAECILKKKVKSEHIADAFSLVVAFSHNQKMKRIMRR